MASKVYSMNTHGRSLSSQTGLVAQMLTLFDAAGFGDMITPGDAVAIKLHCGEWNNTAYLRPVYARALADRIKELGGRPFVCDTVTSTYSRTAARALGLDILMTAERNGYTSAALGCPFIVADGYNGTDDMRVDLPEGFILKEAYIAKAIALADVVIALTHFKGHGIGVIGGSIKNLGIGAQSRRGKFNVHMGGHPRYGLGAATDFYPERCKGRDGCPNWQVCEEICPWHLFHVTDTSIEWDREGCTGCLAHHGATGRCGVTNSPEITYRATCAAMADGCLATVKAVGPGKVGFINMAIDVSPSCDCVGHADMPVVPHLGVFAGYDPVALDKATVDAARAAPGIPGSAAEDYGAADAGARKFTAVATHFDDFSEEIQIEAGARNGLGSKEYELVEVPPRTDSPWGFPDRRSLAVKFGAIFGQEDPFPHELYGGQGFKRAEEVDLDSVSHMD
ncbi:MAG: DUF362 domain-containing protein [Chloroflexota bacterium]